MNALAQARALLTERQKSKTSNPETTILSLILDALEGGTDAAPPKPKAKPAKKKKASAPVADQAPEGE